MDIATCQEWVSSDTLIADSIATDFNEMIHLPSAQHAEPVVRVVAKA
jgi:hypothetical protein